MGLRIFGGGSRGAHDWLCDTTGFPWVVSDLVWVWHGFDWHGWDGAHGAWGAMEMGGKVRGSGHYNRAAVGVAFISLWGTSWHPGRGQDAFLERHGGDGVWGAWRWSFLLPFLQAGEGWGWQGVHLPALPMGADPAAPAVPSPRCSASSWVLPSVSVQGDPGYYTLAASHPKAPQTQELSEAAQVGQAPSPPWGYPRLGSGALSARSRSPVPCPQGLSLLGSERLSRLGLQVIPTGGTSVEGGRAGISWPSPS